MMDPSQAREYARIVCRARGYSEPDYVGAGAFKIAFKASDDAGELYAVKIYKVAVLDERAIREIRAMQRCDHPHIAKFLDFGDLDVDGIKAYYLIEPFIEGGELSQVIEGGVARSQVLGIGRALISALQHMQSLALVHRDIKPGNIIYDQRSGHVTLLDLGIVRDLQATGLTGSWVMRGPGTPFYSSPEQLNNEKETIDWRSDQFSLGLVLAEMILGQHPYHEPDEDYMMTVERVARREPMPQQNKDRLIREGFDVVVKMLEPWPAQRYRKPATLASSWAEAEVQ